MAADWAQVKDRILPLDEGDSACLLGNNRFVWIYRHFSQGENISGDIEYIARTSNGRLIKIRFTGEANRSPGFREISLKYRFVEEMTLSKSRRGHEFQSFRC